MSKADEIGKNDTRAQTARYYDLAPPPFDDISFYRQRVHSHRTIVLELGCGTGRVLVPLAENGLAIHGLDSSPAMLEICRERLATANIPPNVASVGLGDISAFSLGQKFDLLIAPYRVFQNLESDEQVDGFFRCVREHLVPGGSCILNVFRPLSSPDELPKRWDKEHLCWEKFIDGKRMTCHETRPRMNWEPLIIYPGIIYRTYAGDTLEHEADLQIAMRCYYPEQFLELISSHRFEVINKWGGYAGEPYGEGPELVVEFI